jgi:hypothetical protein
MAMRLQKLTLLLALPFFLSNCDTPPPAPETIDLRDATQYFNAEPGDFLVYDMREDLQQLDWEAMYRVLGPRDRNMHQYVAYHVVPRTSSIADTVYYRAEGSRIYVDRFLGQETLFADLSQDVTPDYNGTVLRFDREIGDTVISDIAFSNCILLSTGWKYRVHAILARNIGIVEYLPPSGNQQRLRSGSVRGRVFP